MSVENFIDTNIFIYQLERLDIRKATIAEELIRQGIANKTAGINFQIVQECLNTALRKAQIQLSESEMRSYLQSVLGPLLSVQPSIQLYNSALDIRLRYPFSFYDSLIIAVALEAGCTCLYSEDMQDGQQIRGLTIQNPFT